MSNLGIGVLVMALFCGPVDAQPVITVKVNQPAASIQPTMWGVFFEDINLGADGGIYAELVKNRSFEFAKPLMGWTILGKPATEGDFLVVNRRQENAANPRFLRVTLHHNAKGSLGISNEGFRGMGIKKGLPYHFSLMVRQPVAGATMDHQPLSGTILHIELVNAKGEIIGGAPMTLPATGDMWAKQSVTFTATATEAKASMRIWFEGDGSIDMDMVSLFPDDTWKGRPGGMRADMVQMLADMRPGFIRFPGGCIVEGVDLSNRYQWKKTLGPIEERQLIINRWNFEFPHRSTPDYFQTFGLGFFEYFQLAEDIGAEPLPVLNCGMACQFNSAELVSMDQLDPYVQDALDLVEFANGDTASTWGRVRAGMGHPAPFHLKMLGVGNENWGPQYIERLQVFTKAIKQKYPEVRIVNSSGTDPEGERFDFLNGQLRKMNADIIDEHYYRRPEWFLQNASRYDKYDRKGPKIFAGEYAAQSDKTVSVQNRNNWQAALAEAAFMTGLERNADVVCMASYAPLFAHVDGWQWTPDMIWVDNLRSMGTPNYYVQKLFSLNKGTQVVPALIGNEAMTGQQGLYGSACIDQHSHELILKLVNTTDKAQDGEVILEGKAAIAQEGSLTVLKSDHPADVNTLDHPDAISPEEKPIHCQAGKITLPIAPLSFTVLRVRLKG